MPEHHALVYAGTTLAEAALPSHLMTPNADVVHFMSERFGIDSARTLVAESLIRPLIEPVRTFICAAREWPIDAQNALLKLLEEPPTHAVFILIVPRPLDLLPTLRSRVQIIAGKPTPAGFVEPSPFITMGYAERIEYIAALSKNQDTAGLEAIIDALEVHAAHAPRERRALLSALVAARQHFGRSGSSKKMFLEHLALLLPPAAV